MSSEDSSMSGSNGNGNRQALLAETEGSGVVQYFDAYYPVLKMLPYGEVERVVNVLAQVREEGRTLYLFGNGGSAALASHFACDLGKGTPRDNTGKLLRVMALTDNVPMITAWANDCGYED